MSNIIEIRKLTKAYKTGDEQLVIIRDLDLDVEENSSVVITGASGSGKSTLLNLISGLDSPTSGSVKVLGSNVEKMSENELTRYRSSSIGLVFQFHYLLNDFTAAENVMLPCFMAGNSRKDAMARAEHLLDEVGLSDRLDHYPLELSGGERQRVAVARALVNEPDIILADEPTGNLDEKNSGVVEELLFRLIENHRKTLVLVTHDMRLAERGDRIMVIEHGELRGL